MTREELVTTISQRPLDTMEVIHVHCRPAEKSNEVLVTEIDGHRWYAERPKYLWSPFDLSFLEAPYLAEQHRVYPDIHEPLNLFDQRGLFWSRHEMSSFGLLDFFTANPARYLAIMSEHTNAVRQIVETLTQIGPTLGDKSRLSENLQTFVTLYGKMYEAHSSIFILFDELAWQAREFLLAELPKPLVNEYFPNFLAGEATKKALELGYVAERGALEYATTRGVLYAMQLPPRAFYAEPHLFTQYSEDRSFVQALHDHGIGSDKLERFMAYRLMLPAGFQINEEAQYIETAGLSAHLGVVVKAITAHLGVSIDAIQTMTVPELIQQLDQS